MTVKLLIETGSGSHTTSSASCQAKFKNGPHSGKFLYQAKEYQISAEWHEKTHERWVTTVYELPNGTEIEIIGKGRTGNRGSTQHAFHRVYRLDEKAPVLEFLVDVGLRDCDVKGRLVLLQDMLTAVSSNLKQSQTEGF